jgi:hypothetical protein
VPEKVKEVEKVQEVETEKEKASPSPGFKRPGYKQKQIARKKRKVVVKSNSEFEGDKETQVDEEEQDGSDDDRKRVMALTVLSTHTEPEIINVVPLGVKHPIFLYTVGIREGNKLMCAFKRTNDLWSHLISDECVNTHHFYRI